MKIAILGWGSLIWQPRDLPIEGTFQAGGPTLPIEFCRISSSARLTLVIDEWHGVPVRAYVAKSEKTDLHSAMEDLRIREGMPTAKRVGFIDNKNGKRCDLAQDAHPNAVVEIDNWLEQSPYDIAIWTALGTNFSQRGKGKEVFSVAAAVLYLERLSESDRAIALEYIRKAPAEVITPVRDAVNARWPI